MFAIEAGRIHWNSIIHLSLFSSLALLFFFFNTSRHSRTLVPSDTSSSVPPHRVTANRVFEDTRIQG